MQIDFSQLNISFTAIAIISAFLGAVANILARTLLKNIKSREMVGINFLTMGAVLLLISPLFYKFEASTLTVALIVLIALIDTVANYFFFKTFEKTEASTATPMLSLASVIPLYLFPAFTLFLGRFAGDVVGFKTYFLATLIMILVVIFSIDFKNLGRFKTNTLMPALIASFLFGVSAIPSKILLDQLQAINAPTLYMFRAGFIAFFSLLLFGFPIIKISLKQYRIIFVRSLFVIVQWVLIYYAFTKGSAGVTLTLSNITPIFVFILSAIFLRERPTFKKVLAASLVLVLSLII